MKLNSCQQNAADMFLDFIMDPGTNEMVITGPPGRGKTFLVSHLLDIIPEQTKLVEMLGGKGIESIYVTATTNKAADVLSKQVSRETSTIHSFLGLRVKNDFSTGRTKLVKTNNYEVKWNTLIIVDESSMADTALVEAIRSATMKCKVLYIGDRNQLAPVFEPISLIFRDNIKTAVLKESMRFHGAIEELAEQLNETVETGIFKPIVEVPGIIDYLDEDQAPEYIRERFAGNPEINATKIVTYSNKQTQAYNSFIREELHGLPPELTAGEYVVSNAATRIIGTKAEMTPIDSKWTIEDIGPEAEFCNITCRIATLTDGVKVYMPNDFEEASAALKFHSKHKNWEEYFKIKEWVADLRPVHACTVHKSQGSTYDEVYVDLGNIGTCRNPSDLARLLNVACSRAKHRVVLFGQLPAKYQDSKGVSLF